MDSTKVSFNMVHGTEALQDQITFQPNEKS